jgi:3'(2'), 5'-bisphosphate nucleotidase
MDNNLKIAIEASLEAGNVIMAVYDTAFNIEFKEDKSPLTEADRQANDVINSFLTKTEFPIISEENKQTDYKIRKQWKTCWIVDPVDGTKEFIKRNGEFTVNIALVTNGKPVLGVIYVPATRVLYYADVIKKKGFIAELSEGETTINHVLENSKKIQPSSTKSNGIKVIGSRSHMNEKTLDYIKSIETVGKNVEIVSKGSSLKFCLLAQGLADVYPRFAPTMEWDTAAGQAICNAVGIDVISQETKQPLLYNKKNLLNPWFIVTN